MYLKQTSIFLASAYALYGVLSLDFGTANDISGNSTEIIYENAVTGNGTNVDVRLTVTHIENATLSSWSSEADGSLTFRLTPNGLTGLRGATFNMQFGEWNGVDTFTAAATTQGITFQAYDIDNTPANFTDVFGWLPAEVNSAQLNNTTNLELDTATVNGQNYNIARLQDALIDPDTSADPNNITNPDQPLFTVELDVPVVSAAGINFFWGAQSTGNVNIPLRGMLLSGDGTPEIDIIPEANTLSLVVSCFFFALIGKRRIR